MVNFDLVCIYSDLLILLTNWPTFFSNVIFLCFTVTGPFPSLLLYCSCCNCLTVVLPLIYSCCAAAKTFLIFPSFNRCIKVDLPMVNLCFTIDLSLIYRSLTVDVPLISRFFIVDLPFFIVVSPLLLFII